MTGTRPTLASISRRGTGCALCCSIRASSTSPTASCAQRRTYGRLTANCSLPEGRPSKAPTIEQVLRLFEHQTKHALYDGDRLVKQFADPLTPVQSQILHLLSIPASVYGPGK